MEADESQQEQLDQAHRAEQAMEVLGEAFDAVEKGFINALKNSEISKTDYRELINARLQCLEGLQRQIQYYIDTGKLIEAEIREASFFKKGI